MRSTANGGLDEPGAGLNEREKAGLGDVILSLSETGRTILFVDHDMLRPDAEQHAFGRGVATRHFNLRVVQAHGFVACMHGRIDRQEVHRRTANEVADEHRRRIVIDLVRRA